jgi:hypothetical protein
MRDGTCTKAMHAMPSRAAAQVLHHVSLRVSIARFAERNWASSEGRRTKDAPHQHSGAAEIHSEQSSESVRNNSQKQGAPRGALPVLPGSRSPAGVAPTAGHQRTCQGRRARAQQWRAARSTVSARAAAARGAPPQRCHCLFRAPKGAQQHEWISWEFPDWYMRAGTVLLTSGAA